jgi:DNA end-binding protein Ku
VAARAYWKGYLKLSLVSCPIALFPAATEREKISFNQLNKETGNRVRYRKVDAETGDEVPQENIIKGYEVAKGEYIELDAEELEAVAIDSKHTLEIEEFVPKKDIDQLYLRDPYYIVPDGDVGQQPFAVIRDAIRKEGMVVLGKVVFTTREHIIALEPRDNGMVGTKGRAAKKPPRSAKRTFACDGYVISGNKAYIVYRIDLDHADWGRFNVNEVAIQEWANGKVQHERFVY